MWIIAHYLPISFFSLKPAAATSSGGKTLLVPTPYAIKMALLDVAIRTQGITSGEGLFPSLRALTLQLEAPEDILVMKSFSKIQRPIKDKNDPAKVKRAQERGHFPMQPTIAYREYVNYKGTFRLACQLPEDSPLAGHLPDLLMRINYLGKRGGFIQIVEPPETSSALPAGRFIDLTPGELHGFSASGTLNMLDDCGEKLTFERANIYSGGRVTPGKERIIRHVVLPYRLTRSSRSYSWYQYQETGV
jgi:hypothetical protein